MKRVFGLIGFPLEHSWSKRFFNQKFLDEAIVDAVYENFPLQDLSSFRHLILKNERIAGLNVTIPHKQEIIKHLDDLDQTAEKVGAVNTIKVKRNEGGIKLTGFNTDVVGFESSLQSNNISLDHKALILGSGGAFKAVGFVLEKYNCPYLVVSRNPKGKNCISYNQITKQVISEHRLIINTTPLGMFPNIESLPQIPYNSLTPDHVLFDLVYNPTETSFLKKGKEVGSKTINGLEMLELQALESWRIWNEYPLG